MIALAVDILNYGKCPEILLKDATSRRRLTSVSYQSEGAILAYIWRCDLPSAFPK